MIPLKDTQEQVDGLILADAYHVRFAKVNNSEKVVDNTRTICYGNF